MQNLQYSLGCSCQGLRALLCIECLDRLFLCLTHIFEFSTLQHLYGCSLCCAESKSLAEALMTVRAN